MTISELRGLFSKAYRHWSDDNAARHAAALAFYAILALAPLLLFAVSIAGQFLDSASLQSSLLQSANSELGKGGGDLVKQIIQNSHTPGASLAGAVSLLLALLAASGLFGQLEQSVTAIWGISKRTGIRNFLIQKLIAVVMVLVFVSLILVWLGIDAVISYARAHTAAGVGVWPSLSFLISVAFLTLVFGISFKALPRGLVGWGDVWIPAFVTAFGFAVAKYLLSLYFGLSGVGAAYGPAGALVVILLWFYYSAQIFFYGIELTFTYTYGYGKHKGEPEGELQVS